MDDEKPARPARASEPFEPGGVEIVAGGQPQNGPALAEAGEEDASEAGARAIRPVDHLMKAAARHPAPGQMGIDRIEAEGENRQPVEPLECAQARAQGAEIRVIVTVLALGHAV